MLTLGPIGFAAPWVLAVAAGLPLLWWLLRAKPPAPLRMAFPPVRLLFGLVPREETAERTPWWLLVLRLLLILLLIVAAAGPVLHPRTPTGGGGPLVLMIDDGWAAAANWSRLQTALGQAIASAGRDGRAVLLLTTAPGATGKPQAALQSAALAGEAAEAIEPKPWPTDRPAAVAALRQMIADDGWQPNAVLWLSDGVAEPGAEGQTAKLAADLAAIAPLTVLRPPSPAMPHFIRRGRVSDRPLAVEVVRATDGAVAGLTLRLVADDGTVLGREAVAFDATSRLVRANPVLPAEWLDRLARIDIEGEATAGSVLLVDDGWKRRPVGLVSERPAAGEQPLIGTFFFVERALAPLAEIRRGNIDALLSRDLAVLTLADVGSLDAATAGRVESWVRSGGVLVRFAGPNLLKGAAPDSLFPVVLRPGDRSLGGALSWGAAGRLAPFSANGPFAGLAVPSDVEVHRQVLAEPGLDLAERTWARLEDGTPLITGARLGQGWVVLIHTTANAEWSTLPLSGIFVDLLERIIGLGRSQTSPAASGPPLKPLQTLDGFGELVAPPPGSLAIAANAWPAPVDANHPPGYYGGDRLRLALNLGAGIDRFEPIRQLPDGVRVAVYGDNRERDLAPPLLAAALCLTLLDLVISLAMRGSFSRLRHALASPGMRRALLGAIILGLPAVSQAAPPASGDGTIVSDGTAIPASLSTRLAFIRTGDSSVDRISEAGLVGLSQVINRRTAADLGPPVGVDPEMDELVFFPLLYWPLTDQPPALPPAAVRRLTAYLRTGGSILFDTRDSATAGSGLGDLARQLDLPPLVPVGDDHVLKRAYYLLGDLPGRWTGRPVWVEPASDTVNDGVSAVIAGSNDWAGAWAIDANRRPLLAVAPGGERQRELAYRFGVNVVLYVLTGNYKADQVHLPTILERLGQ